MVGRVTPCAPRAPRFIGAHGVTRPTLSSVSVTHRSLLQPIEFVSNWWRDGEAFGRPIVRWRLGDVGPIGVAEAGVLLQQKAGRRRRPGHNHTRTGPGDGQEGRAWNLDGNGHAPEAALERVIAAAHGACVR